MSQYSTGLSSVTNNSPTVTGTNTLWLANVTAGDSFTVAGDGVMYDVASVDSDTQVTLSVNYAGSTASGVVYAIGTGFTVPDSFPEMSQGDIETATIFTRAMRKIQGKFSAIVSDVSGKAEIAGQTFTGDIEAPKITASTGILFGTDTAAANTLDDYEEGTWTPSVVTGALTFSDAKYIKIGRMVTLSAQLGSFTDITTAEPVVITGLPYATSSSARSIGSTFFRYFDYTDQLSIFISPGTGSIAVYSSNRTTSYSPVLHSDLGNSAVLMFTITLQTD